MSKRRASLAAFLLGVIAYAAALYFRVSAFNGDGVNVNRHQWVIGRAFAVCAVGLLVTSVVLAILAPPERPRTKIWWVVPATVTAIVIVYFDFIVVGFG